MVGAPLVAAAALTSENTMSRLHAPWRAFALCAIVALSLPGCLKSTNSAVINKDGSGKATISLRVDQSKMDELNMMLEGLGMSGRTGNMAGLMKAMDVDTTAKAADSLEGIKVVSKKSFADAEKKIKGGELGIEFTSLQHFARSGLALNMSMELTKNDEGNYELTLSTMPKELENVDVNDPMFQSNMEQAKGMMPMFEPYVGDLEMSVVLRLPTEILATNGTKGVTSDGEVVSWKITFADLTNFKLHLRKVTFKGEGLDWKPFKINASEGAAAMSAARAKLAGEDAGGVTGPAPLPGSQAELEARLVAQMTRIAALQAAVEAATKASDAAEVAAKEARQAADRAVEELAKAQAELTDLQNALKAKKHEEASGGGEEEGGDEKGGADEGK